MKSKQLVLMGMFIAIAVAGSTFVYLPVGIIRAYPIQHAINVMAAVLFGPVPAVIIAFLTGAVRVLTGTGSLLAFPGGMIGAFLAGIFYMLSGRLWLAAAGEIIGTGIIASVVAVPYARILMGTEAASFFFMPAFLVSSISGSLLGVLLMYKIRKINTNNLY